MTKDYKTRKKRAQQKKDSSIGWGPLLIGIVIGLVIGLVVYLYVQFDRPAPAKVSTATPATAKTTPATTAAPTDDNVVPEKSRFDFYTLLPEMEIFIPEQDKETQLRVPKLKKPGTYILQVGSFKRYADADAFKAQLALKGFESTIQTVTIDNTITRHRVRIGPIKERKLSQARARLRKNDLEFMLLKIKSD